MSLSFLHISSDLPAQQNVRTVIVLITVILVSLVFLGLAGMEIISGLRGFVGAEGLWSKGQKSAVVHLIRYSSNQDKEEYDAFKDHIKIPKGHKQARLELDKPDPDLDLAYQGLIQGGNHPQDVENMVRLFRWFRNIEYIERAIDIWERGDGLIEQLEVKAEKLHKNVNKREQGSSIEREIITKQIMLLDENLTVLEGEFSFALGEATRWAKNVFFLVMAGSAAIASIICMWLLLFIGKIISKVQLYSEEVVKQSKEIFKQNEKISRRNTQVTLLSKNQQIINELLRSSLDSLSLTEYLQKALKLILNVPWLSIQSKGAIFLWNEKNGELELTVQQDLATPLQALCSRVPMGRCLCGQAAESRQLVFSNHLDERHEISYDGIEDHGHYCIPVMSGDRLLGVLNFYLLAGHVRDEKEEEFLHTIANTIAGLIERNQSINKLQESEEKFRSVTQSLLDGIVSSDENGNIIFWNKGAKEIFGYEEEEALGEPLTILMPEKYRPSHTLGLKRVTESGTTQVIGKVLELEGLRKNGEKFPLEMIISTWETEGTRIFSAIIRDLTELKKTQDEIHKRTYFDSLTGLANRELFQDRLQQSMHQAIRSRKKVGIILFD
jgi:PAS domain S-box-containing protein